MTEFEPVLLTLPSLAPSLALEVLPYGLTLHRIYVQADGRTHDIVVGPEYPQDHATRKYTNTIIGRYTNRVPVGTHELERHGIKSQFTAHPNGATPNAPKQSPRVSLHGGPEGFDAAVWTRLNDSEPPSLFTPAELAHFSKPRFPPSTYGIFRLVSPDGDQGYPGRLVVETLVALLGPDEVKTDVKSGAMAHGLSAEQYLGSILLVYRAKLDDEAMKTVVTPLNLTQHWGFNLEASLKDGSLSVKDHNLTIKADSIAELDSDSLPTFTFLPTADNPSHTHNGKRIGESFPEKSYDDFYLLSNPAAVEVPSRIPLASFDAQQDLLKDLIQPQNATKSTVLEPVVELSSAKSGLGLAFHTNQHGVMFYANGLANPSVGSRKKIHGGSGINGSGDSYGPGTAAFLEFHNPLAAFLDPNNRNEEDTLVTNDELYHNYVRCDIYFKVPNA